MKAKKVYYIVDYLLEEFLTLVVTSNLEHYKRVTNSEEFISVSLYGSHNELNQIEKEWDRIKSNYDAEYIPASNIHARQEDKKQVFDSIIDDKK